MDVEAPRSHLAAERGFLKKALAGLYEMGSIACHAVHKE
jgi:hypothetical protein